MKYWFQLNSKVDLEDIVERRHPQIIGELGAIEGDWGIKQNVDVEAPKFGTSPVAIFSLYRKMNNSGIKGRIIYMYRGKLVDHHEHDDMVTMEFNSAKIDMNVLLNKIIYQYIQIFDVYMVNLFPEELIYNEKLPIAVRSKINYRNSVEAIYPFFYWSGELIERALNMSSKDLYKKLKGEVYSVEEFQNGVLVKASNKLIGVEESNQFSSSIQRLLGITLPVGEPFR